MRLNYYGTIKYVRVMAENAGLGVVFHDGSDVQPHTDGKSLHVARPNALWSEDEWVDWFYTVLHEIGHETPNRRDWKQIMQENEISIKSFFGALWNLFEDYGQEYDQYGIYSGRDEYLSKGRAGFVKESVTKKKQGANKYEDAWRACWVWDMLNRESWMPNMVGLGTQARDYMTPEQSEYLYKLLSSNLDPADLVDCPATVPFVKDVLKVLGFDPEKEQEASSEAYQQEKQAASGEGEGEEAEGSAKKAEAGDEEGTSEAQASGVFEVDYEELLSHKHEKYTPHFADIHINYDNVHYSDVYKPRDMRVADFVKGTFPAGEEHKWDSSRTYKEGLDSVSTGNGLANKARRLLQVMSQSRWQHSQRKGKLSTKNLYKVNKNINTDTVFKQKSENNILDTAVVVLGDFSGSMSGDKIVHSMKAMILLNEAIGKLNVPLEMLGFTDDYSGPLHYIFKSFNSRISPEMLEESLLRGSEYLYRNADGESITWAYERLIKQSKKRKILIVLSDGSPAPTSTGDGREYAKKVISHIENNTPVEIYGIGIMDDNVLDLYKHSSVINSANELEKELINVIQHKILGDK